MPQNLLRNGGFELDWGEEKSHRCLIFPESGIPHEENIGNIFTPPGWVMWFRHESGTWDQPEGRDSWKQNDPHRVKKGEKAFMYFAFFRQMDAGLFQQVDVEPGTKLRLTGWAHAWSNHLGRDEGGHPHDGRWSDGAGFDAVAWKAGTLPSDTGEPQKDAKPNFTFQVGIDPTGGTDPLSDTVVWGQGYHIYNSYCQELAAEATAEASTVTVFLRSKTLWKFNHNDAYWDDVRLIAMGKDETPEPEPPDEPDKHRGDPREQYTRTYVLLPPDAGAEWAIAVVDGSWDEHKYTIGGSADDSGIGDLDVRRVIAVNPGKWPTDLRAFFEEYYHSVEYIPIEAANPQKLREKLERM